MTEGPKLPIQDSNQWIWEFFWKIEESAHNDGCSEVPDGN